MIFSDMRKENLLELEKYMEYKKPFQHELTIVLKKQVTYNILEAAFLEQTHWK